MAKKEYNCEPDCLMNLLTYWIDQMDELRHPTEEEFDPKKLDQAIQNAKTYRQEIDRFLNWFDVKISVTEKQNNEILAGLIED